MSSVAPLSLEDLVVAVYCALDDALKQAGVPCVDGKLVTRPGTAPVVDDREILCLSILQELLGFESDNQFTYWLKHNAAMKALFPRQLSRPNFADRRAILTGLMETLSRALCDLAGEGRPPFASSIRTQSWSAAPCTPSAMRKSDWEDSRKKAIVHLWKNGSSACANT